MNGAFELGVGKKEDWRSWGTQVQVRLSAEDLAKLDELLVRAKKRNELHHANNGKAMQPSRSSILTNLVREASLRLKGGAGPRDLRQLDVEEMIERSKLAPNVDRVEASAKKLERKAAPKKKQTAKRKAQIAAARKRFAKKGARR